MKNHLGVGAFSRQKTIASSKEAWYHLNIRRMSTGSCGLCTSQQVSSQDPLEDPVENRVSASWRIKLIWGISAKSEGIDGQE